MITITYQDAHQGFSEGALADAVGGMDILSLREYLFVHQGLPHLLLVLELESSAGSALRVLPLEDGLGATSSSGQSAESFFDSVRLDEGGLQYRDLVDWRAGLSRILGAPSSIHIEGTQTLHSTRFSPQSLPVLDLAEQASNPVRQLESKGRSFTSPLPSLSGHSFTSASSGSDFSGPQPYCASFGTFVP